MKTGWNIPDKKEEMTTRNYSNRRRKDLYIPD
jgi:hypothetical protein